MSYRRKRYYKKRYYRNDGMSLDRSIPLLMIFVVIGALRSMRDWYLQLDNRSLLLLWLVIIFIFGTSMFLIIRKWNMRRKLKRDVEASLLERNRYEEFEERSEQYKGLMDEYNDYDDVRVSDKYNFMQRLRELKPRYFEEFIAMLFVFQEYEIIKSPTYVGSKAQKDGGIDLIVSKDGIDRYIQIKKEYAHETGVSVVRELSGVIKEKKGMVISSSIFSDDAKAFAELEQSIVLVDYSKILEEVGKISISNVEKIEDFINDKSHIDVNFKHKPRTCPICFAPLKKRKGFYGCLNYYNTGCDYKE